MIAKPNRVEAYSVTLLQHAGRYLLLHRAASKAFAPGLWTGVGGRVEQGEYADLRASALREVFEETGISDREINNFALRRVMLHNRPGGALTLLLYFTGSLAAPVTPPCPEGTLSWRSAEEIQCLPVIETSRPVVSLLIEDCARDPLGQEPVQCGLGIYTQEALFLGVIWGEMYR